jgi:hypothetical protein
MVYTKKTWVPNEQILATDLNNMENGIEAVDLLITTSPGDIELPGAWAPKTKTHAGTDWATLKEIRMGWQGGVRVKVEARAQFALGTVVVQKNGVDVHAGWSISADDWAEYSVDVTNISPGDVISVRVRSTTVIGVVSVRHFRICVAPDKVLGYYTGEGPYITDFEGCQHDHSAPEQGGDITEIIKKRYTAGTEDELMKITQSTSTTSATYVKGYEVLLDRPGALRISWNMWVDTGTGYAKVYRNGTPVGTEFATTSTTGEIKIEEIDGWQATDKLQIYFHGDGTNTAYMSNLIVSVDYDLQHPRGLLPVTPYRPKIEDFSRAMHDHSDESQGYPLAVEGYPKAILIDHSRPFSDLTRFIPINVNNATPKSPATDWQYVTALGGDLIISTTAPSAITLVIPVALPVGATIRQVGAYGSVTSDTWDFRRSSFTETISASVVSGNVGSATDVTYDVASGEFYYLEVNISPGASLYGGFVKIEVDNINEMI